MQRRTLILVLVIALLLMNLLLRSPVLASSHLEGNSLEPQGGTSYYVATDGSDSNPGTEAWPFRTISHGTSVLGAGDILYVRNGVYHEHIRINQSGTVDSPIRVTAYPGEHPVIDGQGSIPSGWGYLLQVSGDYVVVEGLEVRNSGSLGVGLVGQYGTVRDLYVHHSYDGGILATGAHNTIENCESWWNSTKREYGEGSGYWSWGISAVDTYDITIRGNTVHQNWGEGIGPFRCNDVTIEDNVSYDNMSGNIYLNRINDAIVQRNLVYGVRGSLIEAAMRGGAPGISLADEGTAELANLTIVNNTIYDTESAGIFFWQGASGSGLKNCLIAHNTSIVPRRSGLTIQSGNHRNTRIANNIFDQADLTNSSELEFDHNLWVNGAPSNGAGEGDLTGNPRFLDETSRDFRLKANSPAIDAGTRLSEVRSDFSRVARPVGSGYDIGAYEYFVSGPLDYHSYLPLAIRDR